VSSTEKMAFLNNLVGVFEYEADEAGNTAVKSLGMEIVEYYFRLQR
jgi:hypothetical protein